MTVKGYSPYCGSSTCKFMPRTKFDGEQFVCPDCGWRSAFQADFIKGYINKWKGEGHVV